MIRGLTKSYLASAAIAPFRIAAMSNAANNRQVATATGPLQPLAGTTGNLPTPAGDMADLALAGIPPVQLGGPVGARDPLTSDANGKAVKATVAGQRIIGFADQPGVADDIIDYVSAPGVLAVGA